MTENIPPHAHCLMCGKAVPVGETLCSEECRQKYNAFLKKKKIVWYFFLGLIVVFTVIVFLSNK
ncbi:MAG: DUF2116 family Zn-ribbon domain-containing protein [Thermoplasmata archaeon]|nr:MAG: DUF2116 family Zn-ribbon domain-containing protein [Thermoplasmata archaeon]